MPKRKHHKASSSKKLKKLARLLEDISSSTSDTDRDSSDSDIYSSDPAQDRVPLHSPSPRQENPILNEQGRGAEVDLSGILGINPDKPEALGPPLHEKVLNRWTSYLTKGVEKESLKELVDKYKVPSNCGILLAPGVNPEVLPLLSETQRKSDGFLFKVQTVLCKGLCALGKIINNHIENPVSDDHTRTLADTAKLLANGIFDLSRHRRYLMSPALAPSARKVAENLPIDTLLFGSNFHDKCKNAKEVEKNSIELKAFPKNPQVPLNYQRQNYKQRKRPSR